MSLGFHIVPDGIQSHHATVVSDWLTTSLQKYKEGPANVFLCLFCSATLHQDVDRIFFHRLKQERNEWFFRYIIMAPYATDGKYLLAKHELCLSFGACLKYVLRRFIHRDYANLVADVTTA
jgi:hypothetical protein